MRSLRTWRANVPWHPGPRMSVQFHLPIQREIRRVVFHGIICKMRRAWVATIAKILVFVALPIVLAWGGWVLGTTWHPVMVPCRYPTGGPVVIGGTCLARPFWTRPQVLEAIGGATGLIIVAIMLIALRASRPTPPDHHRTSRSEVLSA